jgi:hypothetical protein
MSYVSLKELSEKLCRDKSSVCKYALKNGVIPIKRVTRDSRNQLTLVFTEAQSKRIILMRDEIGFSR